MPDPGLLQPIIPVEIGLLQLRVSPKREVLQAELERTMRPEATVIPLSWASIATDAVLKRTVTPMRDLQFELERRLIPEGTVIPLAWAPQDHAPRIRIIRVVQLYQYVAATEGTVTPLSWQADEARPRVRVFKIPQLVQYELERMLLFGPTAAEMLSWIPGDQIPNVRVFKRAQSLHETKHMTAEGTVVQSAWTPIAPDSTVRTFKRPELEEFERERLIALPPAGPGVTRRRRRIAWW